MSFHGTYYMGEPTQPDYVFCPHCGGVVDINMSEIYSLLKSLKGMNPKMDFDKLLAVVKASQIATLETQCIMLQQLQDNTNTDYTLAISAITAQITAIQAL